MRAILFMLSVFYSVAMAGQAIKGKIVDANSGNPLAYATISLFSKTDSLLVDGNITDQAGIFSIATKPGIYFAKFEFLAYEPFSVDPINLAKGTVDLGNIALKPSATDLEEVVVQAEKSTMQMALDKRIFNVGKDLGNAGNSATEILANIPSVSVDVEGNVSLRGSNNVRILIDGKPSGMVSFKGAAGLRQLQGSLIERVEIITNPSARYEAEGVGGIINIVLKKELRQGFNGAFDLIAGYPMNLGTALNLNYRKDRLNFFINYGISYRNPPGKGSVYQEVYRPDTTFLYRQNNERTFTGLDQNIRGGLDFYFNPNNILTAAYTYRRSSGNRIMDIEYTDYIFDEGNPVGITTRRQDEDEVEPSSEYTLNFKKLFGKKGHELTATLRYLDNWEESDQDFTEHFFNTAYIPSGIPDLFQHSYNYETEEQLLFQLDYVKPFAQEGKLEAGIRSGIRNMTNDYLVEEQFAGVWKTLQGFDDNFLYDENIHAAYGIVGNKKGKFSYQLGLRAEWTDVTTTLVESRNINARDYLNFFPSLHFTLDLPRENAMQVSYSRRIRRPRYNDLSPFVTYSDNRNYFSGNPDLEPEFTDAYEIGHIKYMEKASISSSIYYRHTNGKIERIRRVDNTGNAYTQPENLSVEDAFGAEFTTSYSPTQKWKLDGNFNFFRAITDGKNLGTSFQSDTYSWFTRLTSRYSLTQNMDLQIRGNYEAKQRTPQGYREPIWFVDLALSSDILKKNGTLTLNVSDLFNTRRFRSVAQSEYFYTYNQGQMQVTQVNLTFSYRLHQQKKRQANPFDRPADM